MLCSGFYIISPIDIILAEVGCTDWACTGLQCYVVGCIMTKNVLSCLNVMSLRTCTIKCVYEVIIAYM